MRPTLLLADDSVTIQRVIELTFAHEDIRVVATSDGRQAIERINLERPDIVLADVSMPHVDGYEVSSFVKQSPAHRHVPVLLLTGAFEPIDEERVKACGCDGVLVKPFGPQELVTRVKDLLAARHAARLRPAEPTSRPADRPAPYAAAPAAAAQSDVVLEMELDELDSRLDALDPMAATPAPVRLEAEPAAADTAPEPLEPPAEPVWDLTPTLRGSADSGAESTDMVPVSKVSLSSAFSALLAAEASQPTTALAPVVSEAVVEDVVRRVLERITGDMVKTVVLDAAERLVMQEIERLKADSASE
jgi:CheY-like chemotaxis protein